ncbi:hypothetical protein [Halovivax limisalsi]|uniref:hypothetical protein n=1 Tax=Halovivax limisalsi TaxID=1453760 RepID=UPI001FFD8574|nr:hypothetical protein [Halovivax limisalsi]
MQRLARSRRELLATGAVASAVAGCALPREDASPAGRGELTFEGVSASFAERARTVADRVTDLSGNAIAEETTVRLIDPAEMRERGRNWTVIGATTTQRLAHRALGLVESLEADVGFEFAGAYYPGSRTLLLVGDEDDIDDQLLAHELCHAVQFQSTTLADLDRSWAAGFDTQAARQALVEGTAQYLEDEYVGGCGGDFSNCHLSTPGPIALDRLDPALLLAYGAYCNGHDFAAALAEREGWRSIWAAHENPPTSTGQILRPEWYPDREPVDVAAPDEPPAPWSRLDTERLGMQSVFLALWHAGVLPVVAAYPRGQSAEDEVFSDLVRYRSPVSDAWRGDAFTAFERADGRFGWRWRIRWASPSAAETGYEHFRERTDARGEPTDESEVWTRDDRYEALTLDDEALVVASAPDPEAFELFSPAFR